MVKDSFLEIIQQKKLAQDKNSLLSQYELPLVTVDIVIFTVQNNRLKVLLIQRKGEPFQHSWAIPGGFIHSGESLKDAAARRLKEETTVDNVYLEQVCAFGEPRRDPRGRVITIAFFALVSSDKLKLEARANAEDVNWFCVTAFPDLAFDHQTIVNKALHALKEQLNTSPIAFQLLAEKFTLTELQRVYELIQERALDKRNFRKKILSTGILKDTGETKMDGYHRPAHLYAFANV